MAANARSSGSPWLLAKPLKRCRDSHGGFLVGGEHYVLGASHSSAILWNVSAIRAAIHYRGMLRQRGYVAIKQTVGE